MKKVKQANGYIIYQSATQRDVDNYHCEIGNYNIYLATDIRDYGLSNSYAEWEDEDSLAVAIAKCNGSQYAVACALADELSDSTVQDMDLVQEIERRLEAGEALESIRESYDIVLERFIYDYDGGHMNLSGDPASDEYDPCGVLDEDELDGDLEDVPDAALAEADNKEYYGLYAAEQCPVDDPREFSVYCPNCGQKLPCGPEDIYYDELGWHTVCPVCDGSFDVDPPQEWLDYDWIPADHVLVPADDDSFPREEDPAKVDHALSNTNMVTVAVYADTTGFFTEAECDRDNTYYVTLPYWVVYSYICKDAGYDVDVWSFDHWLSDESTCDDTLALMEYARSQGVRPIKYGMSNADVLYESDVRSHATYAVLRDPDDGTYETLALARREDESDSRYIGRFLTTVAGHYAFNDCGGWEVMEIVVDGWKITYDGWRPMMEMVFRIADTGEIIYDVFHDEWDH